MDTTRRRKSSTHASTLEIPNGISPRHNTNDLSSMTDDPAEPERRQRRKRKKRQRRNDEAEEESFACLFLRTGTVIAFLFLCSFSIYRHYVPYQDVLATANAGDDDYNNNDAITMIYQSDPNNPPASDKQNHNPLLPVDGTTTTVLVPAAAIPPLPAVNVSQYALQWDAFALAAAQQRLGQGSHKGGFWKQAAAIRQNFTMWYGNEETARALLDRGFTFVRHDDDDDDGDETDASNHDTAVHMPTHLRQTACRILIAKQQDRPFQMAFGGYSVTAGRGNYFHQAYPAVLRQILHPAFAQAGLELHVHNAAIGGCPSFPYGWCFKNFWGTTPDVVSWDFSMNEAGGDPKGLEAYLRRIWQDFFKSSSSHYQPPPQVIVRDTALATNRRILLQNYSRWFPDSLSMHIDPAAAPYLKLPETWRPQGFREWRKFGAPKGAPGQALHHPAVAEHCLMAYILAMYYLAALELVVLQEDLSTDKNYESLRLSCDKLDHEESLPRPWTWTETTTNNNKNAPWKSLLVGNASNDWRMTDITCRTSFEPIVDGDLASLIVAGSQAEDLDILKPRSKMFYNKGWTLDLAHEEKQAKKNLLRYGGLGFVDSKKAYYGIEMSGWLRMLLPFEKETQSEPQKNDLASKWFRSLVLCQVHDRTTSSHANDKGAQCQLDQDVDFLIGGANATASIQPIMASGSLYLGKKVCYYLSVPPTARLTTVSDLFEKSVKETRDMVATENELHIVGRQQPLEQMIRLPHRSNAEQRVGLALEMRVRNPHIIQVEQACSVAHVIWEEK